MSQMAKLEFSLVINRPVEQVFAFKVNFENDAQWSAASGQAQKTSEGPIGVGTTFRQVSSILGRQIENELEITEYEPNRKYTSRSKAGPFPFQARWIFEPVEGGTRVSVVIEAEPAGFFKLAEPILVSITKRQFQTDLENLKELMEAHAL